MLPTTWKLHVYLVLRISIVNKLGHYKMRGWKLQAIVEIEPRRRGWEESEGETKMQELRDNHLGLSKR